ncbi:MAG: lipid-transfer protein [bacterium]|nr:lipid-transfer protein [Deltaproteobacteria bacterium]MCP4908879.1 lipid-transfer protein [bacterium]
MGKLDQVAIAGIGNTEFSKNSGRSENQLAAESIKAALDDAGLAPADVDGMVTFTIDNNEDVALIRNLGICALSYSSRIPHGGGGAGGALVHAAGAIVAGLAEVVVVWRAMNERSETRFGQPNQSPPAPGGGATGMEWSVPWGAATPACWQSMVSQRYMVEFGVENADLAQIAVLTRKHAANNPNAFGYRRPITVEDHQNSRWIVEPILRLLDCCQESDGGQAFVLTSLERARDLKQTVVRVCAGAQHVPYPIDSITNFYQGDFTEMVSTMGMAKQLYEQSGIGPDDIQVAQLYDHFTPIVLQHLEAWGFCGKGEGMDFVRDGNCELEGRLPVNTHGGLIGEAYIHGLNSAAEAVRQIRGTAINQIAEVEYSAFSSGMTGLIFGQA